MSTIKNKQLQQHILDLTKMDQELRESGCKTKSEKEYMEIGKKIQEWDTKTTREAKKMIKKYGWPTFDLIGKRASKSFWLLVQHADKDVEFQKKCLKLMEKAVENDQAYPKDYAYLVDRVLCAEGKKQKFGTQFIYNLKRDRFIPKPVIDSKNVNKRRTEYGLKSIERNEEWINKRSSALKKNLRKYLLAQKKRAK